VACCGANKDGSLRIIRSGVGIEVLAELDMTGLQAVWSLTSSDSQ
jgi:DNA damage-binding protein 1